MLRESYPTSYVDRRIRTEIHRLRYRSLTLRTFPESGEHELECQTPGGLFRSGARIRCTPQRILEVGIGTTIGERVRRNVPSLQLAAPRPLISCLGPVDDDLPPLLLFCRLLTESLP